MTRTFGINRERGALIMLRNFAKHYVRDVGVAGSNPATPTRVSLLTGIEPSRGSNFRRQVRRQVGASHEVAR
jgi:hypothetical protein